MGKREDFSERLINDLKEGAKAPQKALKREKQGIMVGIDVLYNMPLRDIVKLHTSLVGGNEPLNTKKKSK